MVNLSGFMVKSTVQEIFCMVVHISTQLPVPDGKDLEARQNSSYLSQPHQQAYMMTAGLDSGH